MVIGEAQRTNRRTDGRTLLRRVIGTAIMHDMNFDLTVTETIQLQSRPRIGEGGGWNGCKESTRERDFFSSWIQEIELHFFKLFPFYQNGSTKLPGKRPHFPVLCCVPLYLRNNAQNDANIISVTYDGSAALQRNDTWRNSKIKETVRHMWGAFSYRLSV